MERLEERLDVVHVEAAEGDPDVGRRVGSRPGYETMITDYYRSSKLKRDTPSFNILGSPAMDWFPIGNEATRWSIHGETLSLQEVRERIPRIAILSAQTEIEGNGVLDVIRRRRGLDG